MSKEEPRFVIVNDVDRPYQELVAQDINGKCYHMMRSVPGYEYKKKYDALPSDAATDLEDFGFKILIREGCASFHLMKPSKAKYKDGSLREWQGLCMFELPLVYLGEAKEKLAGGE